MQTYSCSSSSQTESFVNTRTRKFYNYTMHPAQFNISNLKLN